MVELIELPRRLNTMSKPQSLFSDSHIRRAEVLSFRVNEVEIACSSTLSSSQSRFPSAGVATVQKNLAPKR